MMTSDNRAGGHDRRSRATWAAAYPRTATGHRPGAQPAALTGLGARSANRGPSVFSRSTAGVRPGLNALAWLGALGLAACQAPAPEAGAPPAAKPEAVGAPQAPARVAKPVVVQPVQPGRFAEQVELSGTTKTDADARLVAQTGGTVQALVARGSHLKKGQRIARINPAMTQAGVAQAAAAVKLAAAGEALAQDSLRRQRPLFERGVISALEFQRVQAQAQQAAAQRAQAQGALRQARERASYAELRAPFDGVLEQRYVELGEQVAPGSPVARLVSSRWLKLTAGVPERYVAEIRPGAAATVSFSAYGLPAREVKLSFVGAVIDPASRTFEVEARLDNADGKLKPDMVVRVSLVRKLLDEALAIPLGAVVRDELGAGVYVVAREGGAPVAQHRRVRLGPVSGPRVVVEAGLKAGDSLVVQGQNELSTGDRLEIKADAAQPGSPQPGASQPGAPQPAASQPAASQARAGE